MIHQYQNNDNMVHLLTGKLANGFYIGKCKRKSKDPAKFTLNSAVVTCKQCIRKYTVLRKLKA